MRVLFPDPTYDREDAYLPEQFHADLKREAASISAEYQLEERNFGRGADWPMYIITLAVILASGKKINDNIDGWIGLASRLREFCAWLASKCVSQWVDEHASAILALHAIVDSYPEPITSIELGSTVFVAGAEIFLPSGDSPDFQPVGVYVHIYQINSTTAYAVIVRSTGVIEASVRVTPENPIGF